jgi:hypothetical protein
MECQNTQNVKNTHSQYARGFVAGALTTGAILTGAYAVNRFVLSGIPCGCKPESFDTVALLKTGAKVGGTLASLGTLIFFAKGIYENPVFHDSNEPMPVKIIGITLGTAFATILIGGIGAGYGAVGNVLLQGAYHITSEALSYINPFS